MTMASSGSGRRDATGAAAPAKENPMTSSTCFVCLGELKDARLLACLHSCCRQCIDKMAVTASQRTIACPVCRTGCTLPPNGAGGLPRDTSRSRESSKRSACVVDACSADNCDNKSTLWCSTCEEAFCNDHGAAHLVSTGGKHSIGAVSSNPHRVGKERSSSVSPSCVDHGEPLVLFCVKCDKIICGHCGAIGKHVGHQPIIPIEEAVGRKKKKAVEVVDEIRHDLVPEVGASLQAVSDRTDELTRRASEVRGEIRRSAERAVGMVRAYAQQLVEKVDDVEEACCKALDKQKDSLQSHLDSFQNAVTFCDRLMEQGEGNGADFANLLEALVARSSDLRKTKFEGKPLRRARLDFNAVSDEGLAANLTNVIGTLRLQEAAASKSTIEPAPSTCLSEKPVEITIQTRDETGEELTEGGCRSLVTASWSDFPRDACMSSGPPVQVKEMDSGRYLVSFIPRQPGKYRLQISVNGEELAGTIDMVCVERHRFDPSECHGNISLSEDLLQATRNTDGNSANDDEDRFREYVLGTVGMRTGRHSWKVQAGKNPFWSFVGVAPKPLPARGKSHRSAYGWMNWGSQHLPRARWSYHTIPRWKKNEVVQLDLDCDHRTLKITVLRTGKTNTITGLPCGMEFFPFFCMEEGPRGMTMRLV